MTARAPQFPAGLITAAEAAAYVGISQQHMSALRSAGLFPVPRVTPKTEGRLQKKLYRVADLDAWIARLPTDEEVEEANECQEADRAFGCDTRA